MKILSVGKALPPHYYDQDQLLAAIREYWSRKHHNTARLERLHKNVLVGGRHLAVPMEEYESLDTFGKTNSTWIRVALELGAEAVTDALDRAGITAEQVGALFFVTVTGVATPSIDARLFNRLRLPPNIKRIPIFGLGCVAGAAGVARAADYVRGFPDQAALLLSVELCSLTVQRTDLTIPNLISTGLFGDGAACAVVAGAELAAERAGPEVLATRSVFYPDSEGVMGWDISESGFRIVLSAGVPEVVKEHLRADVDRFLDDHGLTLSDISSWVCHPGGPKVLWAFQEALDLPDGALDVTWKGLREVGNLSSSSVLLVLRETMAEHRPPPGSLGMMLAMGPGFCSELVLLRW
ncbi:MAG: type III polyketide synthase [Alphaproteobacteria bacterium]|nr:type III polyketide synthase [Alphaproteobacteria bacterium]